MERNFIKLIKTIKKDMDIKLNQILSKIDVTCSQYYILAYLKEHKNETINQKDIEEEFDLKNPTVTGLLDRLEGKGYIERQRSIEDSRRKNILITKGALKKVTECEKALKEEFFDVVKKDFKEEEYNNLVELLNIIDGNIKKV
jgi:DNA-binding MarR family transcriptional regulator